MRLVKMMAIVITGTIEMYGERRVVVSLPDRKMVVLEGDHIVKMYPVAVGKTSTPSPAGTFEIVNRVQNPTWFGPGKIVPPGKSNPLGTRWLGLSQKGYGIHGTNVPSSIGKSASHGCIRMNKHDVEELFELISVGDKVELVKEVPTELKPLFDGATEIPQQVASTITTDAGGVN
jgi:lipoprotein-anchoring transpeptidase ErfK/SrfK